MSEENLVYQPYKTDSLVVRGNREKFQNFMKSLGGRWNSKIKNGDPGWVISNSKEEELKLFINSNKLEKITEKVKSRNATDADVSGLFLKK